MRVRAIVAVTVGAVLLLGCAADQPEAGEEAVSEGDEEVEGDAPSDDDEVADDPTDADDPTETIELILAHGAQVGHPMNACGFEPMIEMVRERTDGIVEIQNFPASELGTEPEMLDSTIAGTIDIALFTAGGLGNRYAPFGVLNAAYVFEDADGMFEIVRGEIGQELAEGLRDEADLQLLEVFFGGMRHVTTTDFPARSPDDLAGVRMRIPQAPLWIANAEALGATPTPLDVSEIYTGLQQGVIDAQELPITAIAALSLDEVQDYLILTGHVAHASPVAMNADSWDSLSDEHQQILAEAAEEAVDQARQCEEDGEAEALERWREDGSLEIIEDVDVDAFRERARGILAEQFADDWGDLYDEILEAQDLQ